MARKFVRTKVRLYDYDKRTRTKFLAYAAGHDVPIAEYERLIRLNAAAAVKHVETKDVLPQEVSGKAAPEVIVVAEPGDPPAAKEPPAFHTMLRAQLLVEAKARGLDVSTRMSKAELLELLEKATS